MQDKIKLNVILPKNRNLEGSLRVEVNGLPKAEFRALGRGSKGFGNTSFIEYGNTPTGQYSGTIEDPTPNSSTYSYGKWGKIRLEALAGNALIATEIFKRSSLPIHGGSPSFFNYWRGANTLRATLGRLRLQDQDMQNLLNILRASSFNNYSSYNSHNIVIEINEY